MPASLGKMGGTLAETKDEEYEALAVQMQELEGVSPSPAPLSYMLR